MNHRRETHNVYQAPSMPPAKSLSLGTPERDVVGVIVTAREQQTGEQRVFHRGGRPRDALAHICTELDAMEGDWKVLSMSTPATIFRDLQGTRKHAWTDEVDSPEIEALSAIKRRDMADPMFLPRSSGSKYLRPEPEVAA